MTAVLYPRIDSVIWRSTDDVPPLVRVLGFDPSAGQVDAIDGRGLPTRVDLRLGTARVVGRSALGAVAAGGGAFFGLAPDGAVTRVTAAGGAWRVRLAEAPQALYPQRDGSVLAAAARGGSGRVWLLRPPRAAADESVSVPGATAPITTGASDGVYFAGGDELLGVRARGLRPAAAVSLGAPVLRAAATPSGDRLYVLTARGAEIRVVDRYADRVAATIALPGGARDLRMDPLGRYVLVRPATGDSAWVVAVGTDQVLGATPAVWRADLPLVLPDGAVAAAVGADVVIVDGETLRRRTTVLGGASDLWHVVMWNGFRGRTGGLTPARRGRAPDSAAAGDDSTPDADGRDSAPARPRAADTAAPAPDSARPPRTSARSSAAGSATIPARYVRPTSALAVPGAPARGGALGSPAAVVPTADVPAAAPAAGTGRGFTVQFAAAPTEREALSALRRLSLPSPGGRVVPRTIDGKVVYRVVAGPFATRAEAERVRGAAGAAGAGAWIYRGAP